MKTFHRDNQDVFSYSTGTELATADYKAMDNSDIVAVAVSLLSLGVSLCGLAVSLICQVRLQRNLMDLRTML